eukprot:g9299.t1
MFENSVNTWHVVTIGLALTSNIQVERILELEAELRIPVADPKKHQKLQEKLEQILEKDDTPKEVVEQVRALNEELRLLGSDPQQHQELQLQAQELRLQLALKDKGCSEAEKEELHKNLRSWQDERAGVDAIHAAARDGDLEKLQKILAMGVDKDAPTAGGEVALHWAAKGGHAKIAKFLIDQGANKAVANSVGELPAHWAAEFGQAEVLEVLFDKAEQEGSIFLTLTLFQEADDKVLPLSPWTSTCVFKITLK